MWRSERSFVWSAAQLVELVYHPNSATSLSTKFVSSIMRSVRRLRFTAERGAPFARSSSSRALGVARLLGCFHVVRCRMGRSGGATPWLVHSGYIQWMVVQSSVEALCRSAPQSSGPPARRRGRLRGHVQSRCELSPLLLAGELSLGEVHAHVHQAPSRVRIVASAPRRRAIARRGARACAARCNSRGGAWWQLSPAVRRRHALRRARMCARRGGRGKSCTR